MKKVLFITNIPSPYRMDFFNELGRRCDLTVIFERRVSAERDDSWKSFKANNFSTIFLEGINFQKDKAFCFDIIKHLRRKQYDHIVVTNIATPTGLLAIAYMKAHKIPYEIEGDGGFPKDNKGIRNIIKRNVISGATLYFSTSAMHDDYYLQYGANREKIRRYPFTSLYKNDILEKITTNEEKSKLRIKIGMTEEKIILCVGQFIHRKGIDILIKATGGFVENVGVYIVGGKPTDEYIKLQKKYRTENIHFVGFKKSNELKEYYRASDIFVLPTREDVWGLVINEAMANALPIITTEKCIAGLELVNHENGAIIQTNSCRELAKKANEILNNKELKHSMCLSSLEKIKYYTFENMALTHLNIWDDIT